MKEPATMMPTFKTPQSDPLHLPNRLTNAEGEMREVGLELEFSGLELDEITTCVQEALGGNVECVSPYECVLSETTVGKIRIELDAILFREMKLRDFFKKLPLDHLHLDLGDSLEKILATEAKRVVPHEVIFPPIPITRLAELEPVRIALSKRGLGTEASLFYAFGLHLNVEIPEQNITTLLRYFRAFLAAYPTLKSWHQLDLARRVLPFIDPFPTSYSLKVLDLAYEPNLSEFIADYIEANPTRNRPLDLLPLLAALDGTQVKDRLPDEKIKPRPAFHYRLPNSLLDDPDWRFTLEWNRWMIVESLVENDPLFQQLIHDEQERLERTLRERARQIWRKWSS